MTEKRDTKKLILDAAEALFSARSFDAVPIREITNKAGVRLALASYYFESKQALFEEVIARRADSLNQRRRDALRAVQAKGAAPSVEQILEAFTRPYMEFCLGTEPGWRYYSRLIAQISQSDQWLPLIEKHFNATALIFLDALCESLPGVRRDKVLRAFVFSIHTMVSAFSNNRRIDTLSHGAVVASDLEATFVTLIPFLAGGFHALPRSGAHAPVKRHKVAARSR